MICPRCGDSVKIYEMCYDNKNEAVACMFCDGDLGRICLFPALVQMCFVEVEE